MGHDPNEGRDYTNNFQMELLTLVFISLSTSSYEKLHYDLNFSIQIIIWYYIITLKKIFGAPTGKCRGPTWENAIFLFQTIFWSNFCLKQVKFVQIGRKFGLKQENCNFPLRTSEFFSGCYSLFQVFKTNIEIINIFFNVSALTYLHYVFFCICLIYRP